MLTVDDCNTILEKYKAGYWVEFDLRDYDLTTDGQYWKGTIPIVIYAYTKRITIGANLFTVCGGYLVNHNDEPLDISIEYFNTGGMQFYVSDDDVICKVFICPNLVSSSEYEVNKYAFFPLSPVVVDITDGEYDNKFYIHQTITQQHSNFLLNNSIVELESDEHGKYITLPSTTDCLIGYGYYYGQGALINHRYKPYRVSFREFKELPIPYIPTLYKGTPQSIQVLNTEDDDPISDYQTYYQGRLLKDNIIHLPYDSDDYVDIMVDLKDYRYPFCTVKLKAPTTIYTANSQSDVETAIENGIQTLQVGDTETEVTLNSITLSNVTLINSNIQVSESILNDCQIIDTTYTDNGGNNITNTIFNSVDYTNTAQSNYNEITFNECDIHDSEINLTGTISKSTITDTLILSDGVINIRDNTFTGVGLKEYFPSHLYLTGDYTVTGNTFNLTGEWEELQYNMCLIKATSNFNPSEFIKQNNLQLNITYDDEPTNTFYYNIVDDDKIRAVRL